MIIAKTQQESDLLCEQEISHMVCLNKPTLVYKNRFIVLNNQQKLFEIPYRKQQRTIKTRKYGTLCIFDSLRELEESRYNKGVIFCYCSNITQTPRKKYTITDVTLETKTETYHFEDKENGDQNSVKFFCDSDYSTHNIKGIEKFSAYIVVVERNRFLNNGVQILYTHKLKQTL